MTPLCPCRFPSEGVPSPGWFVQHNVEQSKNRLIVGLTLIVVLALGAVAIRSLSAGDRGASELNATPIPVTSLPSTLSPTATPTPSLTPSVTPLPTASSTRVKTPTSTPTLKPTVPEPTATSSYTPTPYPTNVPKGEPTPLTFLPGTPSPTPVVLTRTNSITETLTLTAPPPMPLVEQPDNVINVLLLGSDQSGIDSVGRTDTIVVATIHPELPAVSLLSIPRDFYAWMPGRGYGKINTAFSRGGPVLMKATIRHNFGIDIDYYARVGFDSFVRIVDALGGVDVAVECPLSDTFPDPASPDGQIDVDWLPGIHHLDGRHALWYARSRWSTSDFDRHRRQQQVLRGLYRQVMSLGIIPKIPSLWAALRDNVSTDLDLPGVVRLGAIGMRLDTISVKSRFVGTGAVESWRGPERLYVLVPDSEALSSLVSEALAPPISTQQQAWRVEVVNATPQEGWGHVAAERLRWEGFQVVGVQRAEEIRPRTQIVDYRTAPNRWVVFELMRLYGRRNEDIISQPKEQRDVDFQVLLGADYDPCTAVRSR